MRSSTYFLFLGLILAACESENNLRKPRTEPTLPEIKLALTNGKNENNLITKIGSDNQFYTIHFESGDPLNVPMQWIQAVAYDSSNWLATFQFHDGSTQTSNFLGTLTFDGDDIVLDPYSNSPLTALARFETPVKGRFRITVKGKGPKGIAIGKTFAYSGKEHEIPILGLYEDHLNEIEFVFLSPENLERCSKTVALQTSSIPNKPRVDVEILKNILPEGYSGLYFISNLRLGLDQTGETRWYYNSGGMYFSKIRNGNFIVADTFNLSFFEVTMYGRQVKEYQVPYGLHHEIVEMPNGNFLVASHSPPGKPFEDRVVELSRSSGAVIKTWDFNNILDPLRKSLPNTQSGDWLHINSLYYDESDNSIVISGRSQCAVVKIDYTTSAIRWILSNHNEWSGSFSRFLLKPVDSQGNPMDVSNTDFWMYGQHSIHRLTNGNLLLYDNGDYRGFYDRPDVPQSSYTRIAEYKINEQNMAVELIWHFDNNRTVFTKFTGYTQNLIDTRLAAYMFSGENTPRIVEVNTGKEVVYDATFNRGKASYYRTLKQDLYGGID